MAELDYVLKMENLTNDNQAYDTTWQTYWTPLAANALTANAEYIFIGFGHLQVRNSAPNWFRILEGSSTEVPDTAARIAASVGWDYMNGPRSVMLHRFNSGATHGAWNYQFKHNSTTGTDVNGGQIVALWMNLDSFNSTDDWRYATTSPGSSPTTYTDGASITLPSNASGDDWIIIYTAHVEKNVVTDLDSIILHDGTSTVTSSEVEFATENVDEESRIGGMQLFQNVSNSQTIKIQFKTETASTGNNFVKTQIFGFRLNAFTDIRKNVDTTPVNIAALNTDYFTGGQTETNVTAGAKLLFARPQVSYPNTTSGARTRCLVRCTQSSGGSSTVIMSQSPTWTTITSPGDTGFHSNNNTGGATCAGYHNPIVWQTYDITANDSFTCEFEYNEPGDVTGNPVAGGDDWWVLFDPTLSAAGPITGSITFTSNLTKGLVNTKTTSEAASFISQFLKSLSNTKTTSESLALTTNLTQVNTGVVVPVGNTITITLVDFNGTPLTNLSNLKWAWFDVPNINAFSTGPTDTGIAGSTNGSGVLSLTLPNSLLSVGSTGALLIQDSNDVVYGYYQVVVE